VEADATVMNATTTTTTMNIMGIMTTTIVTNVRASMKREGGVVTPTPMTTTEEGALIEGRRRDEGVVVGVVTLIPLTTTKTKTGTKGTALHRMQWKKGRDGGVGLVPAHPSEGPVGRTREKVIS